MPQGCDVADIGIAGIDRDARNVVGLFEAQVFKGRPAIRGAIHAIAPGGTVAVVAFAGADPDDPGLAEFYEIGISIEFFILPARPVRGGVGDCDRAYG